MKHLFLLTLTFILFSTTTQAQKSNRTYAITGKSNNNFFWADIKEIDIVSGKVLKTIFEAEKTSFKAKVINDNEARSQAPGILKPTEFGVAACALDSRHNRLYFAPMHFADIRFLDLESKEASFTVIKKNIIPISASNVVYQPEENQITRMVIAEDGFGYALTNDANHLIKFSTGKSAAVEDLGNLVDAASNNGLSIHNKCTSWGGDMLADAFGKLVIISANHHVFTVDVNSRVATFTGTITGLPANYTTNGAVVNNDGDIVLSSANVFEGLYKCNFKDLKAVGIPNVDKTFNASDLANGNFLLQKEADATNKFDLTKFTLPSFEGASDAKVFPNPVTGSQFNVFFEGQKPGRYNMLFTDLAGRTISSKIITISRGNQVEICNLLPKTAKGTYLIKVLNEKKQLSFSEKIIVQ